MHSPVITVASWALVLVAPPAVLLNIAFARGSYRDTRRRWPAARWIWLSFGVGEALLMCALFCVGLAGVFGLEVPLKPVPRFFLWAGGISGGMGILLALAAAVGGVVSRLKHGI